MEELTGIFVGFKAFQSSKNNKMYYVVSLLFISVDEINQHATYFVKDIFVNEKTYFEFINSHAILGEVDVKREIVGDSVRYYI